MVRKTGLWVVIKHPIPGPGLGDVISVHRSVQAATRQALDVGGRVESANLVALMQRGLPYVEAFRLHDDTRHSQVTVPLPMKRIVCFRDYTTAYDVVRTLRHVGGGYLIVQLLPGPEGQAGRKIAIHERDIEGLAK